MSRVMIEDLQVERTATRDEASQVIGAGHHHHHGHHHHGGKGTTATGGNAAEVAAVKALPSTGAGVTGTSDEQNLIMAGGVKTALFGGEGLFFARLRGPGKVWIQSLPFSRLAGRMMAAAGSGGQNRGEGSVLGGLGDLIGGNN